VCGILGRVCGRAQGVLGHSRSPACCGAHGVHLWRFGTDVARPGVQALVGHLVMCLFSYDTFLASVLCSSLVFGSRASVDQ
jgi:hypothetical protein